MHLYRNVDRDGNRMNFYSGSSRLRLGMHDQVSRPRTESPKRNDPVFILAKIGIPLLPSEFDRHDSYTQLMHFEPTPAAMRIGFHSWKTFAEL